MDWAALVSFRPTDRAALVEKYTIGFYAMAKRQLWFFNSCFLMTGINYSLQYYTPVSMVNQEFSYSLQYYTPVSMVNQECSDYTLLNALGITRAEDAMDHFEVVYLGNLVEQTVMQHLLREGVSPIARATHFLENRLDNSARELHEGIIRQFIVQFCTHKHMFYALGTICLHLDVFTVEELSDIVREERELQM